MNGVYWEPGDWFPCSICGRLTWVQESEQDMGEPKVCSLKCAEALGT